MLFSSILTQTFKRRILSISRDAPRNERQSCRSLPFQAVFRLSKTSETERRSVCGYGMCLFRKAMHFFENMHSKCCISKKLLCSENLNHSFYRKGCSMESLIVVILVGSALVYMIMRWRKAGRGQCSCGCSGCAHSGGCSKGPSLEILKSEPSGDSQGKTDSA